jgi:hypothetical protein
MNIVCRLGSLLPVFCLVAFTSSCPAAATALEELLRLAPSDAAFCVAVQDLSDQLQRLGRSATVARLAATPFGRAIRESPEAQKLAAFDGQLRSRLDITWQQIRDDIFGNAVLMTYTPGPPGKPEAEAGLMLIYPRRPGVLGGLITRLNDLQKKSGEITSLEQRTHRNQPYFVRHKKIGGDEFFCFRGPVLAYSDKEAAVQGVIDNDWNVMPTRDGLPPLATRWRSLGVERDFIIWWINPRAFDAAVAAKVADARGAEAAFLGTFERYWKAIDGITVTLNLTPDANINVTVQAKTDALPAAGRRLAEEAARPSAVWSSIPENALFAAAGRVPWDTAAEAGGEFLTADARRNVRDAVDRTAGAVLGRDVLPDLFRHLGPDWGMCVTPPESDSKGWRPTLTAALRVRPGGEGSSPIEQRVLDGLDFTARLAVLSYNSRQVAPLRMRMEPQDGVAVRVIDGGQLPPGLQPAFAWKGGYLVLASTPEAVRKFVPPSPSPGNDASSPNAEVPLMRLALQGWATYIRNYRRQVAAYLADAYALPPADADARINRLVDALELFNGVEVVQRTAPGRATITVRLKALP